MEHEQEIKLVQHFSNVVEAIYEATYSGKWNVALDMMIEATQSNKAFFFLRRLDVDEPMMVEFRANFDYPVEVIPEFQTRVEEDPFYEAIQTATEGEFIDCNTLVDINEHKNTAYYKEVISPMLSHYALSGILCRDGEYESMLVLNRAESDPPYSLQDKEIANLITIHMTKAIRIFKDLRLYKNYASITKSILDQQDKAIVVCDKDANVLIANEFANNRLVPPNEIFFKDAQMVIKSPIYQQRLMKFISDCSSLAFQEVGVSESLLMEGIEQEDILITISPIRSKHDFIDIERECCVVSISFTQQIQWELLTSEYGFTPRETQLVKSIYAKKRLAEISDDWEVSYNTLRNHLQNIFKKLNISSQSELMVKIQTFKS